MTAMDMPVFSASLKQLGRIMSRVVGDALVEDYYADLKEFPLDAVQKAIEHVRKNARFWPRPSALREACLLVPGIATVTAIPHWVDHAAERYFCGVCADSGFARGLECPGDGRCRVGHCGQEGHSTYAHAYTRRCGCVYTNPVLMAERDKARQHNAPQQMEAR